MLPSLLLYNLLLPLALLAMLPGALRKMRRRGGSWRDALESLGRWTPQRREELAALGRGPVWIHAVSVGEVGIATKLIALWLRQHPQQGFALSVTTPTGQALAREFAQSRQGRVVVLRAPLDLPGVATGFIRRLRPALLVLVEAELWPNWMMAAHAASLPVALVNARLSARSEKRLGWLRRWVAPWYGLLDVVQVQEAADAARLQGLGVRPEALQHCGSIKFDPQGAQADAGQVQALRGVMQQAGMDARHPRVLLASTHPGEEALLLQSLFQLRAAHPGLVLLVVPRHVERAAELAAELQALGCRVKRRSQLAEAAAEGEEHGLPVLLIDSTGELRAWQCLADVVIVGKSFLGRGGQNPVEAVLAGKPVLVGPHMENFEAVMALLGQSGAALALRDAGELVAAIEPLLRDAARAAAMAEAGRQALQAHEGATQRSLDGLVSLVQRSTCREGSTT